MFKDILKKYMKTKGLTQIELSEIIGDSQQAISDFLNKKGNPQRKTRNKYFDKLNGFKEFYDKSSLNQVYLSSDSELKPNESYTGYSLEKKLNIQNAQIIPSFNDKEIDKVILNSFRSHATNSTVNLSMISIVITDRNGITEYCNEAFSYYTGFSQTELIGKKPGDLLNPNREFNQDTLQDLRNCLKHKRIFSGDLVNRGKDSKLIICEIIISPFNINGSDKFIGLARFKKYKKMKKLILLLFIGIIYSCSSEPDLKEEFLPIIKTNIIEEIKNVEGASLDSLKILKIDSLSDKGFMKLKYQKEFSEVELRSKKRDLESKLTTEQGKLSMLANNMDGVKEAKKEFERLILETEKDYDQLGELEKKVQISDSTNFKYYLVNTSVSFSNKALEQETIEAQFVISKDKNIITID